MEGKTYRGTLEPETDSRRDEKKKKENKIRRKKGKRK